jgi:hypothetical protein
MLIITNALPRMICRVRCGKLREVMVTMIPRVSDTNNRGNMVRHSIYLKYFIVRNNVLAIAIVWHNATAVEKGTRAGRNTIANTGNPKPIFVWRNAPASAMKKSAMPMLIMHTIIADTSESWYAF